MHYHITFHDSSVGKLDRASKSSPELPPSPITDVWKLNGPDTTPDPPTDPDPGAITACCWWWSSKNADVSSVGKHPAAWPTRDSLLPGLCGSGFNIGDTATWEFPNLTPVTCCTICRKFAGSAVMNVVWVRFDARDFRFEIFPDKPFLWRFGREVSGSETETLETVGVSGLTKGEIQSEAKASETTELLLLLLLLLKLVVSEEEKVFWRALVKVSVSRAETSENQGSRKVHEAERAGKFSEEVMASNNKRRN